MLGLLRSFFKPDAFEQLQADAFLRQLKATPNASLLDVRTPAEVAAGALKGAVNLDFQNPNFSKEVDKLDKGRTYFVYCRSGVRSANACRKMRELGFNRLVNLSGGYISLK